MQIDEILYNAHVISDDKARRVLNTAPNQIADITLKELEQGVTIERLESLTVPVYEYATQITIHGVFKDMPDDLRVCGYKSIFLNQNKSLGVRYVAIDGAKKQLLLDVSWYARDNGSKTWSIHKDSKGFEAWFITRDKQVALDMYNSTPDKYYIGGKRIGSLMYGMGYAVILFIGAVYQSNLWNLINELTGIPNESEYNRIKSEYELKRKLESERHELERKAEREAELAKLNEFRANFKTPDNWIPFSGQLESDCEYVKLVDGYDGITLIGYKTKKFGTKLKVAKKEFKDYQYTDWTPYEYKVREQPKLNNAWQVKATECTNKPNNRQPATPQSHSEPLKEVQPEAKTDIEPITEITIKHNEKLNGIEIYFPNKPEQEIIDNLKLNGFRWSFKNGCWYNQWNDDNKTIAESLLSAKPEQPEPIQNEQEIVIEQVPEVKPLEPIIPEPKQDMPIIGKVMQLALL